MTQSDIIVSEPLDDVTAQFPTPGYDDVSYLHHNDEDALYVEDSNEIGVDDVHLDYGTYYADDNEEESYDVSVEDDQNDLVFMLPDIPGASEEGQVFVEPDGEAEIEEEESDPWDWRSKGLDGFLNWLYNMVNSCPQHSGRDTTGLEKAIAYFEALDKEITKAMREDYRDVIDAAKAEEARAAIEDGLERLVERLEKVKSTKFKRHQKKNKKEKKGEVEDALIKQAYKTQKINGIVITVPLLISHCARLCVNSMVSAGKDIEDTYRKCVEKYSLNEREQAELMQLMEDSGYYVHRDRFKLPGEELDPTSSDNVDWNQNFFG